MSTTDTCNTAQKFQQLFIDEVAKAHPLGLGTIIEACWNHLWCIWMDGGAKATSKHMSTFLKDNLDDINDSLRVSTTYDGTLRAMDKLFGETSNYAKGDGGVFQYGFNKHHPGLLLFKT
mmetsp:Transcript_6023/g.13183  ORF Transcript_6023/g.13183 Transcript_6023/m.13183 type:complete len:119 (-) Transcript_6023:238-594(-)